MWVMSKEYEKEYVKGYMLAYIDWSVLLDLKETDKKQYKIRRQNLDWAIDNIIEDLIKDWKIFIK